MIELTAVHVGLLFLLGLGAGWLGAWVGIGGGVVLVPTLVLLFDIDVKIAIATSLVSVIVTSTAAGSVYVRRGLTNTRIAIALEVATTIGGITGSLLAVVVPSNALAGIFALVMALTSLLMFRRSRGKDHRQVDPSADAASVGEEPGHLAGSYLDEARGGVVHYRAKRLAVGSFVSLLAGAVSGLLGVGGGFLKVPAMNLGMDVPIRVAVATSNLMIGVTAAASVFIYYGRGFVHPLLVAPVGLGVLGGALAGTITSSRSKPARIKVVLALVLLGVSIQMGLRAFGVSLG